jgi:hypothetical protein
MKGLNTFSRAFRGAIGPASSTLIRVGTYQQSIDEERTTRWSRYLRRCGAAVARLSDFDLGKTIDLACRVGVLKQRDHNAL